MWFKNVFCQDADSSKCSVPAVSPGLSYDEQCWPGLYWPGQRVNDPDVLLRSSRRKGRWRCSARQTRADRHQRRPDEAARSWTKPSPAQLCSCLPCLAAEAVAERRREREHMRVAPEVLSTQPPCYGFSLALSARIIVAFGIILESTKSKFSTLNVALIRQMWKDEDWDWEEEGKGLNGPMSG